MGPSVSGASGAAQAIEAIPNSKTVALLEQERQQMIVMSAASRTLTVVAQPKLASPASAAATAVQAASGSPSSGGTTGSTTGSAPPPPVAAPDPGTAQSIAYNLLGSFGFSTSQFSCLQSLWNRESGWSYDAENPSGAYGIPQALPGSKMATAGADWQTNPTTQIEWGLGYIKERVWVALRRVEFRAGEQLLLSGRCGPAAYVTPAGVLRPDGTSRTAGSAKEGLIASSGESCPCFAHHVIIR